MVSIVMAVGMLVFQRLMRVLVPVALGQVQHHACKHEQAAQQHQPSRRAFPESKSQCRTNERCEGEH